MNRDAGSDLHANSSGLMCAGTSARLDRLIGQNSDQRLAFIVGKPLQFMIAAQIIATYDLASRSDIMVCNDYFSADLLANKYRDQKNKKWGAIETHPDHGSAYRQARQKRYAAIFIASDVGVRKAVQLLRHKIAHPKSSIIVYEEGIGTYRIDLYKGVKRAVLPVFGISTHFGRSPLTSATFVFDPDLYRKRVGVSSQDVYPVGESLANFVDINANALCSLFDDEIPEAYDHNECSVYLSNWEIAPEILERLAMMPGDLFLKPHPHINKLSEFKAAPAARVISSRIPAEMVIVSLASSYKKVNVLHHGSSTAHYMAGTKVNFINVEE